VGFTNNMVNRKIGEKKLSEESEPDPWTLFLNAIRAPMTRDRYKTRVTKFFNFIGIRGKTLEQKRASLQKKEKTMRVKNSS